MKIRRSLLKDTVTVSTYGGEGAYGPTVGDPSEVRVNLDAKRRLVRNGAGDEVVGEVVLHVHPDDADRFTPETRIVAAGQDLQVLAVHTITGRGRASHLEVTCG